MSELKGACIIGQSGGPTSVINTSVLGAIETALDCPSITRVLGAAHGIKGVLDDQLLDIDKEDFILNPSVVDRIVERIEEIRTAKK